MSNAGVGDAIGDVTREDSPEEAAVAAECCVRYFNECVNITELYFGSRLSGRSVLPRCFGQLVALESLTLWRNQLTALPDNFGQLVALRRLHLDENQLTTLPDEFKQLVALQLLYLEHNQLPRCRAASASS